MSDQDTSGLSRRNYVRTLVAVGGTTALGACLEISDGGSIPTGSPDERPDRQHAWNAALDTDADGNHRNPEHHVLLALDLVTSPDSDAQSQVETALQSLERAYAYDTAGLLFTIGYTPAYFDTVGADAHIPDPEPLTDLESPELDTFDTLVHLASDNPDIVLEAEEALVGEISQPNNVAMDATFDGVFERAGQRRTGFVGPGLPAEHTDKAGVPDSVPDDAPFFMGFRSGFSESQAPEQRVTIQEGPYAGGTTTHVESLDLQLRTWFEQDSHFQRVAKMFSPEHAQEERVGQTGDKLTTSTGVSGDIADRVQADAREEGVVGHAQKAASARDEDGTPPLLRRDFNTVDGGGPGVHFLAHQRSIADYVRVRRAVAGQDVAGEGVGQRLNNGILQYIFVRRRGNFLVPPRDKRALPTD